MTEVAVSPVVIGVGVAYFAICALIGLWAARRTRTAEDFFLAGRNVGLLPFAIAAMATTLSGFSFIGGPGLIYSIGLTAVFIILPAALTNTYGAIVLGARMRRLAATHGFLTVPDAIGWRYGSPAAQGLSAVAILAGVVGYIGTNVLALGLVVRALFGVELELALWLGAAVLLAYSAGGGILAGIWVDVFQGLLMAVASTIVFVYALDSGSGLTAITRAIEAVDPAFMGPWGSRGAMVALSFFFVFAVGSLGQPHIAHKYYMIRDVKRLRWYPVLMTIAMILAQLLFVGVGIAVKSLVVTGELAALATPDEATPTFLLRYVPTFVSALVFSGVAAAIMSTVNSFLNIGAAALTHDIPKALGKRVNSGTQLRDGRLWTIVLAVIGTVIAQVSGTLVAFLGIFGYGLFACTLVPALAIGLTWKGGTRQAAIASIATGLTLTLALETAAYVKLVSLPTGVTVSGLTLVTSILVYVGVSRWTEDGSDKETTTAV
jgi:Na+/proline symporter